MAQGKGWDSVAHAEWTANRRPAAIAAVLARLNSTSSPPAELALQAAYYLFLDNAFGPARHILETASRAHPDHLPLLLNLSVLYSRTRAHAEARGTMERYVELGGSDVAAADGLCASCHHTGDDDAARRWGTQAIEQKTREAEALGPVFALGAPRREGSSVISFSLWGRDPRYLRGAVHNALRAPLVYPGFTCRFAIDGSVPDDVVATLEGLGADIHVDPGEPTLRHRLTRRFLVADDPAVARYLVRDCDSLVNSREAVAVRLWIESGKAFHVMRDWWTHTDPILAGMWGGLGGVLPPIAPMIAAYRSAALETPNWDQWFLRDCVWPSIRREALVHDRLFTPDGALPFPGRDPPGNLHVGQDEYAVRRRAQADELAPFGPSTPSLGLDPPGT